MLDPCLQTKLSFPCCICFRPLPRARVVSCVKVGRAPELQHGPIDQLVGVNSTSDIVPQSDGLVHGEVGYCRPAFLLAFQIPVVYYYALQSTVLIFVYNTQFHTSFLATLLKIYSTCPTTIF
jgi:hypothetical protein